MGKDKSMNIPVKKDAIVIEDFGSNSYISLCSGVMYFRKKGARSAKQIGYVNQVNGHNVYFKAFDPNKHVLRKFNSVGINAKVFDIINGEYYIGLRNRKTGDTLYARVSEALPKSKRLAFPEQEEQIFIPLEIFKKEIPQASKERT